MIPFLAKFSYGGAVFIGFLVGMVTGSIAFHYATAKNGNNTAGWIAGIISATIVSAITGGILTGMMGINILTGMSLGAIGGFIGAVVGILH